MSKSLLMKLFTVTIIPLIIAPVLTYAAPNPIQQTNATPILAGPSGPTPVIDFTKSPGYNDAVKGVEETMHLYSLALDSKKLTQLDVLFTPYALFSVDSYQTFLALSAAKDAIKSAPTVGLLSTKHTFVIDTVINYNASTANDRGWMYTSGHWSLKKTFMTSDNHPYNTTLYSTFTDSLEFPALNSPGDKRWQFTGRVFDLGSF